MHGGGKSALNLREDFPKSELYALNLRHVFPSSEWFLPDLGLKNELSKWFALNLGQQIAQWAKPSPKRILVDIDVK